MWNDLDKINKWKKKRNERKKQKEWNENPYTSEKYKMKGNKKRTYVYTVDSCSNGSAYNKNPSLTTFFFVPMEIFLLLLYNGYNNISL